MPILEQSGLAWFEEDFDMGITYTCRNACNGLANLCK